MSATSNKKIFVLLSSCVEKTRFAKHDWLHREHVYKNEEEARQALSRFHEDENIVIDMMDISIPVGIAECYLLYHFHDNYCDGYAAYTNKDEAQNEFYRVCEEQYHKLQEDVVKIVSKDDTQKYEKLISTIYEFDIFDTNNSLSYPDKGDRWVLVTLTSL